MNCLQNRLESFSLWPFDSPDASSLAEAGFFYTGDHEIKDDTVTCFCCGKELGGWESGDDPLNEHLAHPKTKAGCAWALLMSERRNPTIPPDHATLLKARETSFKGWPHEKERGWVGKAKKMAKAGFYFAPSTESPDAVECMYCKVSLDGWEKKDDPTAEHKRRASGLECAFFQGLKTGGAASSIFALTKNVFAAEKASQELIEKREVESELNLLEGQIQPETLQASKKKMSTKRKLPMNRSKVDMSFSEHSEQEEAAADPVPIIMKSARKKRASDAMLDLMSQDTSESTPVKKSRGHRTRSNSVSSVAIYAEDSFSPPPAKVKRSAPAARGRRARTPLEDVNISAVNSFASIKEEIVEEDVLETGTVKSGKENPAKRKQPVVKRASSDQGRRITRSSLAITEDPLSPIISDVLPVNLQTLQMATESIAEETMDVKDSNDNYTSACTDLGLSSQANTTTHGESELIILSSDYTTGANTNSDVLHALHVEPIAPARTVNTKTSLRRNSSTASTTPIETILSSSAGRLSSLAREISSRDASDSHSSVESNKTEGISPPRTSNAGRRTSSRRRGSGSTTDSNLEEIIMLDHKARPTAQRPKRKPKSANSQKEVMSSESILEVDEEVLNFAPELRPLSSLSEDPSEIELKPIALGSTAISSVQDSAVITASENTQVSHQPSEPQVEAQIMTSPTQMVSIGIQTLEMSPKSLPRLPFLGAEMHDNSRTQWLTIFSQLLAKTQHCAETKADFNSMTDAELEMSFGDYCRHKAQQQSTELGLAFEQMIASLAERGRLAREAISASVS